MTFNHGVEGSSPSALTNEIGFQNFSPFAAKPMSALGSVSRHHPALCLNLLRIDGHLQ